MEEFSEYWYLFEYWCHLPKIVKHLDLSIIEVLLLWNLYVEVPQSPTLYLLSYLPQPLIYWTICAFSGGFMGLWMSSRNCIYSVEWTNKDLYMSRYLTKSNKMRYVWSNFKISHELLFYEIFSWVACLISKLLLFANVALMVNKGLTTYLLVHTNNSESSWIWDIIHHYHIWSYRYWNLAKYLMEFTTMRSIMFFVIWSEVYLINWLINLII